MKSLNTFLATVAAFTVVLFAVSNREPVDLTFWPLPYQVSLGLYAVILCSVLVGFLAGMIVSWIMGSGRRRELREIRRRVRDLEESLNQKQNPPVSGDSGKI